MTGTTQTLNHAIDCRTVAAAGAISDYSDVLEHGHLKEHPALIAYRLDLLTHMIETVRAAVIREQSDAGWGPPGDPSAEHHATVAEFTGHTCDCDWCVHALAGNGQPF